jgi:phosphinothricin acetyltransferase
MIRPAIESDFQAIASITNHYILNTPIHFGLEPVTGPSLFSAWQPKRALHPFLVSTDERDEVIAYAKAGTWRERAAYEHTAETGIYVRHDARGRGVGVPLYLALIEACKASGLRTLVAGVAIPNAPSERLHERCGFTRVGVFREVGRKMGAWHDVAFYQLML